MHKKKLNLIIFTVIRLLLAGAINSQSITGER